MMRLRLAPRWRQSLSWGLLPTKLSAWLRERGSLTQRCRKEFADFALRPVFQGRSRMLLPIVGRNAYATIRQVVLYGQGKPFIVAHSLLTGTPRGRLSCWVRGLGVRSLGSLLFTHPGFKRGVLHFAPLDARDPLYQLCRQHLQETPVPVNLPGRLWARCCEHRFGSQSVWVTEIFWGI